MAGAIAAAEGRFSSGRGGRVLVPQLIEPAINQY